MATSTIKRTTRPSINYASKNVATTTPLSNDRTYLITVNTYGICAFGIATVNDSGSTNYFPITTDSHITITGTTNGITVTCTSAGARVSALEIWALD